MPTLPTYTPSDFVRRVREDFLAHAATHGVPAIYRAGGVGDGVLVKVLLSAASATLSKPGIGGVRAIGPTSRNQHYSLSVPAVLTGDASPSLGTAVATNGTVCVQRLQESDTFEVHGEEVGEAQDVRLRVVDGVQLVESSYWSATCVISGLAVAL